MMSSGMMLKKRKKTKTKTGKLKMKLNCKEVTSNSPFLKPCTSSRGDKIVQMCVLGGDTMNAMDWFLFNISLDCLTKQGRKQIKLERTQHGYHQVTSGFHHQELHHPHHRHLSLNKDYTQLKKEGLVISPIFSVRRKFFNCLPIPLWGNSFASLGSVVFSIGGSTEQRSITITGSHLVHYMDTRHPNPSWKQAPSLISPRFEPQVVSRNGRLYVFGCSGSGVWAEFLEPFFIDGDVSGQWQSLPEPPFRLLKADSFLVINPPNDHLEYVHLPKKEKESIMVLITQSKLEQCGSAFEFNIATATWKLSNHRKFHWPYSDICMVDPPTLVDRVFYWADENINAYDFNTGRTYVGPVQDLLFNRKMHRVFGIDWNDSYPTPPPRPSFIHLGGSYFCLLAFVEESFHCLLIKVARTQKVYCSYCGVGLGTTVHFLLDVSVVSCQMYPVDCDRYLLDGRILL